MYKDVLRGMEGVAIYPVISLILFFAVFAGMLIWVSRLRRDYIDQMGNMPLDDETTGMEWEGGKSDGRA